MTDKQLRDYVTQAVEDYQFGFLSEDQFTEVTLEIALEYLNYDASDDHDEFELTEDIRSVARQLSEKPTTEEVATFYADEIINEIN